jgi:fimbrial chaperone protein
VNASTKSQATIARLGLKKICMGGVLGLLVAGLAMPAGAGEFSVTPVRIYVAPKDRAAAVTVTNEGDDELVMQADVYTWNQKPGGEDELTLSEDLFLSPPIIKLAPKSRQVVRLAMLRPPKTGRQLTYRVLVREIPEARQAKKSVELQIALAFSLPVFITPPGARRELTCTVERSAANVVMAICENTGTAYAQPREFVLSNVAGDRLAGRDSGGYILPDIKRGFEMKRPEGRIPGGKAKLAVTLDDGSTLTYDVTVPE